MKLKIKISIKMIKNNNNNKISHKLLIKKKKVLLKNCRNRFQAKINIFKFLQKI